MAYQVLARKFRPTLFDDVVGQTHVTRTLRNAIKMGRVHHAFLFTGTRGCGKTSTARILAKALNCTKAGKDHPDPCNECESCKEIASGGSLDVLEIDGASNNGVDAIRELRENVRFLPSKGRYKVYIVDEVHMLSNAAFNALLKTLEEPPAHVIFIFATTEPMALPQTILSRCQRFDFKRIPPRRIAERLAEIARSESIEVGPGGLAALARAAEGSMRDAQSLFDQVISFAGRDASGGLKIADDQITESLGLIDRKLLTDLTAALAARDGRAALDVATRVAVAGYEPIHFAREMLGRLRDLMVVKVVDAPQALVELSPEEIEALRGLAGRLSREEIDSLFLILESALEEMVQGQTPQLALEMAVLRMASAEPIAPIADLVSRLDSIASGSALPSSGRPAPPTPGPTRPPAPVQAFPAKPEVTVTATVEAPVFDWNGYLEYVGHRKPSLRTLLASGALARFDGERVQVGYPASGMNAELIREKERLEQLAVLASEFMKRELRVEVVDAREEAPLPESAALRAPGPAPAPRRNVVEERKQLREEALASDAIKTAISVLGAELAEVRPAGKS